MTVLYVASALVAIKSGADMIGMVFAESRRLVSPQECHDIISAIHEARRRPGPASILGPQRGEVSGRTWFHAWSEALEDAVARYRPLVVGVFADQSSDEVNEIADVAALDLVQLSGGEPVELAERIERPVVLVQHVGPDTDPEDLAERTYPGPAAVLLDTASETARGGTGESFDWSVASALAERLPIMMAGGLNVENVKEAITSISPWAVDVSSGVETNGSKDHDKIRNFIQKAKGANA